MRFVSALSGVTEREAFEDYEPVMILGSARELAGALGIGVCEIDKETYQAT